MRLPLFAVALLFIASCAQDKLPVYGGKVAVTTNGKTDSLDYRIPSFSFTNQNGATVNDATLQNKIYVADFFFTSCPSICPKMAAEMIKVNEKYKNNPDVLILSYSIDPQRDSVPKLKAYEQKLNLSTNKWHFLTGNKDSIYSLAKSYLVFAKDDPGAPGGHIHDGTFVLVDKQRRPRGYYDGTNSESVQKLLADMDILLKEN